MKAHTGTKHLLINMKYIILTAFIGLLIFNSSCEINQEKQPEIIDKESDKDLDETLVAILDSIFYEDQNNRSTTIDGNNSEGLREGIDRDSINRIKVTKILDERGWLGSDVIGEQGNLTLFLVIQHSPIETQLKYLPMMREAVKKGNARGIDLALLEDRVALDQGKRQIYGSQIGKEEGTGIFFVFPIIDPENVDKRRAEIGLQTLDEYINFWGITWDIEEHKKLTKKMENE